MKRIIAFLVLGAINMFYSTANALDACAMSEGNGGTTLVAVTDPIAATSWGIPRDPNDIRRDAAAAAQEQYGNTVAYDSAIGITLQFTVEGGNAGMVYTLPAKNYSGTESIEQFMLNSLLPEEEQTDEDPSPCDPDKNATNGSDNDDQTDDDQTSSGGGSGGGSYYSGGSTPWSGTIYEAFSCETCTVTVEEV